MKNRFAVIDFETTGLSPDYGDRITEVAVVIIESNRVVDQYQSLVNAGLSIPFHIQRLTGITDHMISSAPPPSTVVNELYKFIKGSNLVAHNASFDKKFFNSEVAKVGLKTNHDFICTLLLSRRLYPFLENLKLGTLANYHDIQHRGRSHRALADALVTADLFIKIHQDLSFHYSTNNISPEKFISTQKEPLSNFYHTARALKLKNSIN